MRQISEAAYEWMCVVFEQEVKSFLDDPDEQFTAWTADEFLVYYHTMRTVAEDCGVDFWEVARKVGTEFEIDRLKAMLKAAGYPALHPPPGDER